MLPPQSIILDVGCGARLITRALAQRLYEVHAVDAAPAMIEQTRQLALEVGIDRQVRTSLNDVHHLSFPNDTFDLVLAVGVIPWVDFPLPALKELVRVTKPGGHLFYAVDNRWRLNHVLDPRCFPSLRPLRRKVHDALERIGVLRSLPVKPRHYTYSIKQFDVMLRMVGVRKVKGMTLGFGPFTFLNYRLLGESVGIRAHFKLQRLADQGVPLLRSAGLEYVVLAKKPDGRSDCPEQRV
jgi:SAM-dependent methyltransferase